MISTFKTKEMALTREVVERMIGKYVHARTNMHEVVKPDGSKEIVNVWFAGCVAGLEEATIKYDYEKDEFLETVKTLFHLLLTDGTGYVLSESDLVIDEISEDEFIDMVARFQAEQYAKKAIKLPGRDF